MPSRNKPTLSMVEEGEVNKTLSNVDELKTPMFDVKKHLLMNELFPGCGAACECCLMNPQNCEVLRVGMQN